MPSIANTGPLSRSYLLMSKTVAITIAILLLFPFRYSFITRTRWFIAVSFLVEMLLPLLLLPPFGLWSCCPSADLIFCRVICSLLPLGRLACGDGLTFPSCPIDPSCGLGSPKLNPTVLSWCFGILRNLSPLLWLLLHKLTTSSLLRTKKVIDKLRKAEKGRQRKGVRRVDKSTTGRTTHRSRGIYRNRFILNLVICGNYYSSAQNKPEKRIVEMVTEGGSV